jgi:extradiol dioxygenase family protein
MRPFHLAFPVSNLIDTERFYVDIIGCSVGRRTPSSINFNFHGHQIVAHLVDQIPDNTNGGQIDGKQVPPFHFGLVMEWQQWHQFRDYLELQGVDFRLKPHIRYPGKIGEQATMFLDDPSGNSLEFKSFFDDNRLFATVTGMETEIGGGKIKHPNTQ